MTKSVLLAALLACVPAFAQETPAPAVPPVVEGAPEVVTPPAVPEIPDDGVRVSILGYHELAENQPETAMRIHTSKFRKQMETIRQLGLKVISLDEFTAWKNDGKEIPKKSVMLTFDDGWKSVYTDAYPILKDFGYPFTIFLYKNYVDGGGKALTSQMIQEMIRNGATVGSHSVSHPYPITVKTFRKKGPKAYDGYLRKEMGESKRFLEAKFPVKVTTYAYPGGFYTEEMLTLSDEFGYHHGFTVLPGKIKRSLPDQTLPRYIVLGNYDKIFDLATTFAESQGGVPGIASALPGEAPEMTPKTPYPVSPEAGAIVNSRLPLITADLSSVQALDPASLVMKVAGFGEVPATFTPENGKFSWQVNRRLRQATCQVLITWKDNTGKPVEPPLRWSFQLDREAAYLPDGE
ncbi:MAG: polysaccharide deacetylase family protein [Verrucomicrobiota bacterium]